ncbi:MAG: Hpt domain-containing protein [Thermoguttaceae bacterium]|jgi:Amt family ammonium transporter|nr:Hpt domain-containing protein [Thermoguttaceae bacterium]
MDQDIVTSTTAVFDEQELVARCMGNRDFARRILAKFQSRLRDDLAELKEAFLSGDAERVTIVAHRMKGASANVAAHVLRDRAAAIEQLARGQNLSAIQFHLQELQRECSHFKESISLLGEGLGCTAASTESISCESW